MSSSGLLRRNAELIYRLRGLGMSGAVLHLAAHPDDEDIGLLAYTSRKFGVKAVYWSATRGEGGQNRIGPYQGESLGIFRSWETLAARAIDGGESLYGPFFDFGFSKDGDEGLSKWGYDVMVREIVRAIRLTQPQIVVGRWKGIADDFHGHHQSVGKATYEAFEAAGDPDQFPELEDQGLVAWQPQKFYHSVNNSGGDQSAGGAANVFGFTSEEFERDGILRMNTGEFDPIAGMTYQERAWLAYNQNRTQAMGFTPQPGDFIYYFSLYKSLVDVPDRESEIFDGLDPTLTGLVDYPGNDSQFLRSKFNEIKDFAKEALNKYQAGDPFKASDPLLEGLSLLEEIRASLEKEDLDDTKRQAIDMYLARKCDDFEIATAQCLGLRLECLSDDARVTPGQKFNIKSRLWNQRGAQIDQTSFALHTPVDWKAKSTSSVDKSDHLQTAYEVTTSEKATLACPYWLVKPRGLYHYHWPEGEPASQPFGPPAVQAECKIALGDHQITLREAAVLREKFPGGYRELPLAVVPPISLHPQTNNEFLLVKSSEQSIELNVVARSNMEHDSVEGKLSLKIPSGWKVDPVQVDLSLGKVGDTKGVKFEVNIPKDVPAGEYSLRYVVRVGKRDYDVLINSVRMVAPGLPGMPDETNCIQEEFVTAPATVDVGIFDVQFLEGLNYAYIQGAAEGILDALSHFGLDFHSITDDEMGYIELDQFDAVVIGPNAYLIRDELRKNSNRFLEYVEHGGTLIVQYQGYGFQGKDFTPYPFKYSMPHDRVTYEDQPVRILKPDHFLMERPNPITPADFEGWIMDLGLYFFGEWDRHYEPLLECHDPGESPKQGGMLIANYGKGIYLYTGYSFFRQLPAGNPGAFRLFANLLSLPAARTLERVELLKDVPLFSFMDEEQLFTIAHGMFDRWEKDGVYLGHEADNCDENTEMFVICDGEIEIIKESANNKVVYLSKPGEIIGEMEVLGQIPRAAAMRTKGDVHLLTLKGSDFRAQMHEHPDMSDRVIQMLVGKLAAAGG